MIRVIVFLALVALIAFGTVWIADRPGDVSIVWQGYRIESTVTVMIVAVLAVVAALILIWSIVRAIWRSPGWIATALQQRRSVRGYRAVSGGLIAVGSGDLRSARRLAGDASRIAPDEPLALLLNAQVAQLAGDRTAAEGAFRAMAARDDTKLLGLRGLFIEARRRDDQNAARLYVEEAARVSPSLAWAGQAVLEFRSASGDWSRALEALERNSRNGLVDRNAAQRQRAVLLTARALDADQNDREAARPLALEAVSLAPTLVPAAALAGRLLGEAGDLRRASRVVEKAWVVHPHPDLAETYAHLRMGDSTRERLARVERLAARKTHHPESALAVARAALEAQEFGKARAALKPLLEQPTQRTCELMAIIERREHGDEGRAREWIARAVHAVRDPVWTADGFISDRWLPVSPVSGRLDAFEWKVPLNELGDHRGSIEAAEPEAVEASPPLLPVVLSEPEPDPEPAPVEPEPETVAPLAPAPPVSAEPVRDVAPSLAAPPVEPPVEPEPPPAPPPQHSPPARLSPVMRGPERIRPAGAVIPMIHAPDDPGPEPTTEAEPQPGLPLGRGQVRLF